MEPSTESSRHIVDHTVVSVGPYMFHNSAHRDRNFSAKSGENPSPPHNAFRFGEPLQPAFIRDRQVVGVACITVQRDSSMRCISLTGSCASSQLAIATRPPQISGR